MSFLPVGHTHEDIDQFFSRIATYLGVHNAISRLELADAIYNAYKTCRGRRPRVRHWDSVANISDWIDPYLNNFDGISKWRQFRFYKREGHVYVAVRPQTSGRFEWVGIKPKTTETRVFKKAPPSTLSLVPAAQRRDPISSKDAEKLRDNTVSYIQQRSSLKPDLEDHIADIRHTIDLLAQPLDVLLPFSWPDADALLRVDRDDAESDGGGVVSGIEYDVDDMIFVKCIGTNDESDERFWVAKVVSLGLGSNTKQLKVHWWKSTTSIEFGRYREHWISQGRKKPRKPCLDWIWLESIGGKIEMTKTSTIQKTYEKEIKYRVALWVRQADRASDSEDYDSDDALNQHRLSAEQRRNVGQRVYGVDE